MPNNCTEIKRCSGQRTAEQLGCAEFRKHVAWYVKGWLADRDCAEVPDGAELDDSGG